MNIKTVLNIGALIVTLLACTINPMTGKRFFQIANNSELNAIALQQYRKTLGDSKIISGTAELFLLKKWDNEYKKQ